jgi:hypothetical protein
MKKSASGISPEQRTLRPPKHFDPVEVEDRKAGRGTGARVDAVEIDCVRRLMMRGEIAVARASYRDDADGRSGRLGDRYARRDESKLFRLIDSQVLELPAIQRRNRYADAIYGLFATRCRDDDVITKHILRPLRFVTRGRCCLLRSDRTAREKHRRRSRGKKQNMVSCRVQAHRVASYFAGPQACAARHEAKAVPPR